MRSTEAERELVDKGIARAREKRARAVARHREAYDGAVESLTTEATTALAEALEEWVAAGERYRTKHKARRLLVAVGCEVAAHYAVMAVCNVLSQGANVRDLVMGLGRRLDLEVRMAALERREPRAWKFLVETMGRLRGAEAGRHAQLKLESRGLGKRAVPRDEQVAAAWVLLELLTRTTGLVSLESRTRTGGRGKMRAERVIVPHPDTIEWLERVERRAEEVAFAAGPLPEPPQDWDEHLEGGGYAREVMRYRLVKDMPGVRVRRTAPVVAAAVNALQGTAWRVNRRVFEVAREVWERGLEGPDMPRPERLPLEPFPVTGGEREQKAWRRRAAMTHKADSRRRNQRLRAARRMRDALEYVDWERFHVPQRLDFRGRVYGRWGGLVWTGGDLVRGMLEFADPTQWPAGDPLPAGWLARRLASAWGLSRAPYGERERWTAQNEAEILRAAENPVEARSWWMAAKEPWQLLAACFAWRDMRLGDGDAHLRLPVAIDASNNALQIHALLLRDAELAGGTNVAPGAGPRDAYTEVAALVTRRLEASEDWRAEDWLAWFGGEVGRDVVKAVLVGLVYGAHASGLVNSVLSWYGELEEWPFDAPNAFLYCSFLAWEVFHALREYTGQTQKLLGWFRSCGYAAARAGVPLRWTGPSGFEVVQDHRHSKVVELRTSVGKVVRIQRLSERTAKPDAGAQGRSAPPNYVHSLDAGVLHLALERLARRGVRSIGTAHDAFAVPAAHVALLHRTLRETYAEVFETDWLEVLRAQVAADTAAEVKEPPERGEFDPAACRESAYMVS